MAPFVFLGPEYDQVLKEVYTQTSTKNIMKSRGLFGALFDDAVADSKPFANTLARYVNDDLLSALAAEHRKGRLLLVGATNLDARRDMLWNIGEIAERGGPRAIELIRKILIASASILAAFSPVMIDVETDGRAFQRCTWTAEP